MTTKYIIVVHQDDDVDYAKDIEEALIDNEIEVKSVEIVEEIKC